MSDLMFQRMVRMAEDDGTGSGGDDPIAKLEAILAEVPDEALREKIKAGTAGVKSALVKERKAVADAKPLLEEHKILKADKEKKDKDALSKEEQLATDLTSARTEAETAKSQLKAERIRNAIVREASALGFDNPEDAVVFLTSNESITYSEDGKVLGAKEAVTKLSTEKAYLLKKAKPENHGTPPGRKSQDKGPEKPAEDVKIPTL